MRQRWLTRLAAGMQTRLPRRTVRARLTLLYGGLFLLAGIAVLALTYLLVAHATATRAVVDVDGKARITTPDSATPLAPAGLSDQVRQLREQAARQHAADLHQLLIQSSIALGVATVLAFVIGWFVAGRVLRPLRAMASAAQRISQHNLHERLAVPGPDDEIKHLADTIDGLLGRLKTAFDAQRRFVADVSHELRTPLTWERAMVEVSLTDPDATTQTLRDTLQELLSSGQDQERLIEALLTLATSERGLDRRDPLDLAALTRNVLEHRPAHDDDPAIHLHLAHAPTTGNADLLKRLIGNLIDNAVRYNSTDGHLDIHAGLRDGRAVLTVRNTGPVIPRDEVDRLTQPFQRLSGDRTTHPDGHGLGLSIVAAIATAHDAQLAIKPGPQGGLNIEVTFPHPPDPAASRSGDTAQPRNTRPASPPAALSHHASSDTAATATSTSS